MTEIKQLNYPTKEILGKNQEAGLKILWMLYNNPKCRWKDLLDKRLSISQSTLSTNLKRLKENKYIEKISEIIEGKKNKYYKITDSGKKNYDDILLKKRPKDRQINYPTSKYLGLKDSEINILYILHNNPYCKWKDFLNAPFHINQSVLSKKLKIFTSQGLVTKEKIEESKYEVYQITEKGTTEFIERLKEHKLDRQSILNEESKRIKEILRNSEKLFNSLNIPNDDVKYRLVNYSLNLDFSRVKGTSCTQEQFKKILYYIALNHPNEYPSFTSPVDFSKKYNLDIETLNFFLKEIVDKNQYLIKFLKLEVKPNRIYYFQVNEEIEKRLRAIVENVIKKLSFLNTNENPIEYIEIEKSILDKIIGNLFHKALKASAREFLPHYIEYLKFLTGKKDISKGSHDRLKSVAFRDISIENRRSRLKSQLLKEKTIIDNTSKIEIKNNEIGVPDKSKEYLISVLEEIDNIIRVKPHRIEYYHRKIDILLELEMNDEALETIEKAIILERVLKSDLDHDVSYSLKADILMKLRRYNDALDAINNAINIDLKNSNYFQVKSLILDYLERYDESIDAINIAIKNAPDWWGHYYIKQSILYDSERYEDALKTVEKAIELKPKKASLYYNKANILSALEKNQDSLISIDRAIELKPNKWIYYDGKLEILEEMKRFKEALKCINRAIKLFPEHWNFYETKSSLLLRMEKFDEALDVVNMVIKLKPKNPAFYSIKADVLVRIKDYEKAIEVLKKAIEIEPDVIYYYKKLIEILYFTGKSDEALNYLDSAIEENYESESFYDLKVKFLYELEKYSEALKVINKTIDLNHNYEIHYLHKIQILCELNKYKEALDVSEIIKKLFPESPIQYISKAYILRKKNQLKEALDEIEIATKSKHFKGNFYIHKSSILFKLKKYEEALLVNKELIKKNYDTSYSYYQRGKLYLKLQKFKEAIDCFEEALRLSPISNIKFKYFIKLGLCHKYLHNYKDSKMNLEEGKIIAKRFNNEKWVKKANSYLFELEENN